MQVFTGDMGDYHRSRLTHTHEVSSIARTIGRALRLNEDLIEALALFHDIGHPPYGHAGEDALDECLKDHGGFSHNRNALTIAEELEIRYPAFPGLNLTFEVLEGQATRIVAPSAVSRDGIAHAAQGRRAIGDASSSAQLAAPDADSTDPAAAPLLEVQVVEAADSMTYDAHDSDDAVKLGLVTLDELAENSLVREAIAAIRRCYGPQTDDMLRKCIVHELLARQVSDALATASAFLADCGPLTADEIRRQPFRIGPSPKLAEGKRELERFLYNRVYRHERLVVVRSEAQSRIRRMYQGYLSQPELIPDHHRKRIPAVGIERTAADYIAGMTDRFCDAVYEKHFAQ